MRPIYAVFGFLVVACVSLVGLVGTDKRGYTPAISSRFTVGDAEWPSGVVVAELSGRLLWLDLVDDHRVLEIRALDRGQSELVRRVELQHAAQWLAYAQRAPKPPVFLASGARHSTLLEVADDRTRVVYRGALGDWPSMVPFDRGDRVLVRDRDHLRAIVVGTGQVSLSVEVGSHSSGCVVGDSVFFNGDQSLWRLDSMTGELYGVEGVEQDKVVSIACGRTNALVLIASTDGSQHVRVIDGEYGKVLLSRLDLPTKHRWRTSQSQFGAVVWALDENVAHVLSDSELREVRWIDEETPSLVFRGGASDLVAVTQHGYSVVSF